ncbi:MAG: Rab family GTPase [Candidatus Hodarchaeales archaeon]|jgi:hypothetical protein
MKENFSPLMKICLIGSAPAKLKTGFIRRYADDKFEENRLPTLGVDITTKIINIDGSRIKIILVDIAGQEFFGEIRPGYYRGASGAIIFFDKGDYTSFTEVPKWLKRFRDNLEEKIPDSIKKKYYSHQPPPDPTPVAMVGLITETEEVPLKKAKALADQLEIAYFECLPTEGKELGKVIEYLVRK